MALAHARKRLTVAEFIEMIRPLPDEERWELLDGEAVLMAPQSERHQGIVGNLVERLGAAARAKGCRVLPGLGMLSDEFDDYAPIPDVVVRCGPIGEGGYATDPIVVAEVLSPSTMDNDRGRKLRFYKSIPSLRTILVIYQDEARVEVWQRDGSEWRFRIAGGLRDEIELPELSTRFAVGQIYEDVPLIGSG